MRPGNTPREESGGQPGGLAASLRERLCSYRGDITDAICELVRIPTENPPGLHYPECAALLKKRLDCLGLDARLVVPASLGDAADQAPSIQCAIGTGAKTACFHGHYDVVPGEKLQFEPTERNGHLFGRGSGDMKGGLVAMIYAMKALADCGTELNGRILLTMVPDEETGGARGSEALLRSGMLDRNAIAMFTPEPTGGVVWNACRGAISVRVTLNGKPAHVGHHYRGVNSFEQMLAVSNALMDLKHEVELRRTEFPISPDEARRSVLLLGGEVRGGTNFNVVPEACAFTIDRRINPEEDLGEEKGRLLRVLEQFRNSGMQLDYEVFQEAPAAGVSQHCEAGRTLSAAIASVTGREAPFEMCPGLLEIRFYSQLGIPAFAYGPGLLSVAHGPNEFVSIDKVIECSVIYAVAAANLLGDAATA